MAGVVQRHRPLLRQRRKADRGLRRCRRLEVLARVPAPPSAAEPALRRSAAAQGCREGRIHRGERPPRGPDRGASRSGQVPLLRRVRQRLRYRRVLQLAGLPLAGRLRHRQAGAAGERHRLARADGRRRRGERRALLRAVDRRGAHRLRQARGGSGIGGRLDQNPAQFQVLRISQWHWQRLRRDRALPLRAVSISRLRVRASTLRTPRDQRRRHLGRAHLHSQVRKPRGEARLHARLRHPAVGHRLRLQRPIRQAHGGIRP